MASFAERITGAMKADVPTFEEIEADQTAISQAVAVILLAALASLVGNIWRIGIIGGVMMGVVSLCAYALWTFLIVLIGTKVMPEPSTKADFNEGFRVIGFTAAPGLFTVLAIIPFLGPLISFAIWIWMMVVAVVAIRQVLDYSNTGRAIIVAVIAGVLCWIVQVIVLTPLLVGSYLVRNLAG